MHQVDSTQPPATAGARVRATLWSTALAWIAVVCGLAVPGAAQRYLTHSYADFEGLPSARVNAIAQGGDGVIWVATVGGLVSTDGTGFELETAAVLPTDIAHLETDDLGRVWAMPVGHRTGPRVLDHGVWRAIPFEPLGDTVIDICWYRSARSAGLLLLTRAGELAAWDGTSWRRTRLPGKLPNAYASALVCTRHGVLAADSAGVHWVELDGDSIRVRPTNVRRPTAALAGSNSEHRVYAIGSDWFGRLRFGDDGEVDGLDIVREGMPFESFEVETGRVAAVDLYGGVTFGTDVAAYYFHPELGIEPQTRLSGLTTEGLTSVTTDREGNVWIGTLRGVAKVVTRRFATWDRAHGLFEDEVTAVFEVSPGEFLLGHGGGLTRFGSKIEAIDLNAGPIEGRVMDIGRFRDGTIWVAASRLGLLEYEPGVGTSVLIPADAVGGSFQSVLEARDGTLWIGGPTGVFHGTVDSLEPFDFTPAVGQSVYVRTITQTTNGDIYFATNLAGLIRLRGDQVSTWTSPTEPRSSSACCAHELEDGTVLVGTSIGLFRLASDGLERVPEPSIRVPVFTMTRDWHDRLWLGTNHGVMRWNGRKLETFTVSHGVPGYETNRAAVRVDSRGRVLVGTDRGMSIFRDQFDHPALARPTVTLRSLESAQGSWPLDDSAITLGSSVGRIDFRFRAISFGDEKRVRFLTRLEGLEEDWSEPLDLPLRRVSYANVPPGEYRLHVIAVSSSGERSEPAVSAPIRVLAPIWSRSWFLALVVVALLMAATLIANFLAQRRYARQLETTVRHRSEDLKRMEREHAKVQRLEALGVLAGGIAHDFNNVLTGVLGNLSLLEDDPNLDEGRQRLVRAAMSAATQARSLTQQLLTFSKGGAPVRAEASIGDLIHDCASFLVVGSRVRCEFDLPADLASVDIDEGQISQVVNNLILNAMQAMPDGGTIRIRATNAQCPPLSTDRDFVRVDIEDEGVGIPAELLQRVFDPYFSTKETGSGLGLATAHSIVQQHGGRLSVRSEEGNGTVFTMWLPATSESTLTVMDTPVPTIHSKLSGMHVLVMDDEEMLRRVIKHMLSLLGCTCVTTSDGADAIAEYERALGQRRFDAVIMDLTVPGGVGGLEALRRILDLDPNARVIVASGYSDDPAVAEFARYGFRSRLRKPFRARDLEAAVFTAIDDEASSQAI
ncbi:MAG: response regulator [Planctomycetes bacterium]|nr:response regulator [Planctomycetota bacterium]